MVVMVVMVVVMVVVVARAVLVSIATHESRVWRVD